MPPETSVTLGTDGSSCWELARRPISLRLRPYVRSWLGYSESAPLLSRRRELPAPQVVVIFEFGPPLRVSSSGSEACVQHHAGGFIAGVDDSFTVTEHDGRQAGVQVNLTPLGGRLLLGVPMRELARRVVALPDVLREQRGLADRLANAPSWDARLDAVEQALLARLDSARTPCAPITWAVQRIEATTGRVRVGALTEALGYSRKHLNTLFQEHVGLSPKLYAELVRFESLTQRLKSGARESWATLAFDLGFADQAHLSREVRRFAGVSPTEARALLAGPFAEPLP
ncbi:AraC family transcriptional regulator [Myxococcaceae bacterium JPH2]|nr:AraC family transcriptional regulator [Myxococcaceae bacterium JPH2]